MEATEAKKLELIESVQPFINRTANTFSNHRVEYRDLVQSGYEGTLIAIAKFDESKGVSFFTYAYYWIIEAIQRWAQDEGRTIHLPMAFQKEIVASVARVGGKFAEKHGRYPYLEELLENRELREELVERRLGLHDPAEENVSSEIKLAYVWLNQVELASLDQLIDQDEDTAPYDPASDFNTEEEVDKNMLIEAMRKALANGVVTDRERVILKRRHGLGEIYGQIDTYKSIGDDLDLSRQRVKQIEDEALEKLLQEPGGQHLPFALRSL